MGPLAFSKDILSKMRLSQLRELARRLGVWRYSGMLREQLITSIQVRSPETAGLDEASIPALATVEAVPLSEAPAAPAEFPGPAQERELESFSCWVSLMPQDHQWAIVRWGISAAAREQALSAGGLELALRLTDASGGLNGSALQQVVVAAGAQEWHLPVPLGDRDYRVELGFRMADGGWLPLAVSSVVRMPAEVDPPMAPMPAFAFTDVPEAVGWSSTPVAAPGLHERLYQQASASRTRLSRGSEAFHEQGGDHALVAAGGHLSGAGGQFSGAGLWASGREASGAGLLPRQRSFWLVADAELIVYGATDPAATLTIGDRVVPLSDDGTFRIHATFPDGDQDYPIRALAADGEQTRSITLDFRRTTPHAKVNTREAAVAEWF